MADYAYNKLVHFNYQVLEKFEAGISLRGHEVKSVKQGHISLKSAYVVINQGEAWLLNAYVTPYKQAGPTATGDPERSRKLLLHKKEINYLIGKSQQKGLTLMPIRVYSKRGLVKLEFGLAKHKKAYDKREDVARREAKRKIDRALRQKP